MIVDMEGNKIPLGTRVAAADNVYKIQIKIGTVVGYTEKRVKIDFDEDVKISSKAAHTIVKVFDQKNKCSYCDGKGVLKAPDGVYDECRPCRGTGKINK